MKNLFLALSLLAVTPMLAVPAQAQGTPQTVVRYKVDIANVAVGFRASKLVGATVINDTNDKIGTVDDFIVTRSDRVVYAILSVGGFLGVGDKLVAVPFAELELTEDKIVLAGATKESLKTLPKFTYAK
jgi:sporulation protein YlmC with PRC-barrel domain